ncbi:MAG: hypothetical protein KME35_14690 [Aphanocapsa sp. GSE-SYN-MK-11-07L]|jgi:hypothetical protein|nr:hypothetical protein [Aphanocapsa sp. GSE-SYN-MK-11-07L]
MRLFPLTGISLIVCCLISGCMSSSQSQEQIGQPMPTLSPQASPTAPVLTVEQVLLAKDGSDGKLKPLDENIFSRGENVNMVLLNVKGFVKGSDGKNKFDMDIQVKDAEGKVILSQNNLLGTEGHRDLPGNVARTPYGVFKTSSQLAPGNYTITLTLYDQVGEGVVTKSKTVALQ